MKTPLIRWKSAPLLFAVLLVLAGFSAGLFVSKRPGDRLHRTTEMRSTEYDLTCPLLECEETTGSHGDFALASFREGLNNRISAITARGEVKQLSVYFRDLNNGPWIGVEENREFYPASLLKLPVAMALMRQAETEPRLLSRTITVASADDQNARLVYKPLRGVKPGRSYRTDKLIELALAESDNNAITLLGTVVKKRVLEETYRDLGVRYPADGAVDFVSVRDFATFFRVLYNASYLEKSASEQLLLYLSASSFRSGLVAGVPENVPVAHKHGEQESRTDGASRELHDCGIVYYPNNPYLLCVMSKGSSFEKEAEAIRDISRFVFEEVDRVMRSQHLQGR